MKMIRTPLITLLLLLAFFSQSQDAGQWIFDHYISQQENPVLSIAQDQEGYIWLGTKNGLRIYDGRELNTIQTSQKNNLVTREWVWQVFVDNRKNVIVGTTRGLFVKDTINSVFERVALVHEGEQQPVVREIHQSGNNELWIGTNKGLFKGESNQYQFEKYNLSYELGKVKDIDIKGIAEFSDGHMYIATQHGIYTLKGENNQLFASDLASQEIKTLYADVQNEQLWVGTQSDMKGVTIIDIHTTERKQFSLPGPTESNSVRVIKSFEHPYVWIGTMNGLFRYDQTLDKLDHWLDHQSVRDIYKDKDGGIWIATFNDGVYYHNAQSHNFRHIYDIPTGLSLIENNRNNIVSDIVNINNEETWIGTEYGLKRYNRVTNKFTKHLTKSNQKDIINNRIKCLAQTKDFLWVGTFNGISSINLQTEEIINYLLQPNGDNQNWNQTTDIATIKQDVWIGTNGGGIFHLDKDKKFTRFADDDNGRANYVKVLLTQGDILWVGTNAGLYAIDTHRKKYLKFSDSKYFLKDFNVVSLSQDKKGNLCIGTELSGLIYFNPETKQHIRITKSQGLSNNEIKATIIDEEENIWVTTSDGLSKIMKVAEKDTFNQDGYKIFNFVINTDIGKPVFSFRCAEQSENGTILLGTLKGIIAFNPSEISTTLIHPEVRIKDIGINQELLTESNHLASRFGPISGLEVMNLQYNESNLIFHLGCIDFNRQNNLYYSYQLLGIDNQWHILEDRNFLKFNYLPPGKYTLNLKSSNNKQEWGEEYSSVAFQIAPPFYKSSIAFFIYAIVIIALLYLFYYYTSQWQKMKNLLIVEELNYTREHELHQLKSEFFVNISHELKTPLTLILSPVEELLSQRIENIGIRNRLKLVKRNADKISHLIRQIVEVRKIETSVGILRVSEYDIVPFIKDVASRFNESSRIKNIDFNLEIPNKPIKVWFDSDRLDTVISNLLSNAFKYTGDLGKVSITLFADELQKGPNNEDYIQIIIEDNGKGISPEDIPHLFDRFHHLSNKNKRLSLGDGIGLDLSKKIIDLHKGIINIESIQSNENSKGHTRITIGLRKGKDHLNSSNIMILDSETEDLNLKRTDYAQSESYSLRNDGHEIKIPSEYSILVAESDIEVIEQIKNKYENDFHVYSVTDGLEAWQLTLDIMPNLVITIEETDNISGSELCQRIKIDDRTCHIPVIMLADPKLIADAGDLSAEEFISKPVDFSYLHQRIEYLIVQRERIKQQFQKKSIILKPDQVSSYEEKLLNSVIEYLDNNLSDSNLTIEKISKEIGVSRVHFYRKIKSLMNMSPNAFIRTYRIRKAGQLLEQKKLNVSDVRMAVGFSDADYFRSCFKKEFGVNPNEFIKSI